VEYVSQQQEYVIDAANYLAVVYVDAICPQRASIRLHAVLQNALRVWLKRSDTFDSRLKALSQKLNCRLTIVTWRLSHTSIEMLRQYGGRSKSINSA
jgi:hypothetical protein